MFRPRSQSARILVRPGITDMRKAINGLSVLVEQEMELDPFEDGAVFLFCNRQRRIMKALFWDATGFCLVQKRLEKHRFPWPQTTEQVREITDQQLEMLLSGIDFWHAHKRIEYRSVS
jgi:transposase